jgi:hypothetical protein
MSLWPTGLKRSLNNSALSAPSTLKNTFAPLELHICSRQVLLLICRHTGLLTGVLEGWHKHAQRRVIINHKMYAQ